jgi:hypothetical protein
MNEGIDYKLTDKQRSLLDVISNPLHALKTNREKAELAGVTEVTLYRNLKDPNFIQALRLRGLSESLGLSIPIIKRMGKDALSGKYMQQKTLLEMSGHYTQTPLIQQVIANISQSGMSESDIDKKIAEYFTKPVDTISTTL